MNILFTSFLLHLTCSSCRYCSNEDNVGVLPGPLEPRPLDRPLPALLPAQRLLALHPDLPVLPHPELE